MAEQNIKVQIINLTKTYSNGDGVKNINLNIYEGEILTLLGPSGCGKTTILRVLGGFNDVTYGKVIINGQDVTAVEPEKRPTGMVFQNYNLWPHMTVYENLSFGMSLRKIPKNTIKDDINSMLKMIKMEGTEKKFPKQLSGGQQQRIAIARSLLLKPAVLLLDEPFSALDAKIRLQMREELKRIQSELNITVVFVTHDQEEAMSISHRIVVMDKGRIAQVGTPSDIYDKPVSSYVASFIGEMNFITENDYQIAFRPENIKIFIDEEGKYKGKIQSIMILGHYVSIIIQMGNKEIKAYAQRIEAFHFKEGMNVSFNIDKYQKYNEGV